MKKSSFAKSFLLVLFMASVIFCITGCKKEQPKVVEEVVMQKSCPVMNGPIDKELYTVYKGEKVYFCCPGCKEQFEADPEKYIKDLPQFQE